MDEHTHGNGGCGNGHGQEHGHDHGHSHSHTATPAAPSGQAPTTTSAAPRQAFGISDVAAAKLKSIMEQEKKDPATVGLRIGVQGGGCSGLQYLMDFDAQRPDDRVFENGGARVFIDPRSVLHVSGSVLEYQDGLMGTGFAIKNPNVKGSCGCGKSFTT